MRGSAAYGSRISPAGKRAFAPFIKTCYGKTKLSSRPLFKVLL